MKSYQEALEKLGKRETRKLENNTYLQRRGDNLVVMLHSTDVVTYQADGRVILDSGGWRTPTTKDRINTYAPINLWQDKGQWFIGPNWNRVNTAIFQDGMIINPDGTFSGVMTAKQAKDEQKLRAQIRKYASGFIKALQVGRVPLPSSGDCWGCCMKDVNTGDTVMGSDHIREHLKKKYYVPSLAVNALKAMGASRAAEETLFALMGHPDAANWDPNGNGFITAQIEKTIKRYVYRELGLAY